MNEWVKEGGRNQIIRGYSAHGKEFGCHWSILNKDVLRSVKRSLWFLREMVNVEIGVEAERKLRPSCCSPDKSIEVLGSSIADLRIKSGRLFRYW